jgi:adenine phosphoribosyltransferase
MNQIEQQLRSFVRDVPDYPKAGIVFKDITPLLGDAQAFSLAVDELAARVSTPIDLVLGIESRGFMFAAPLALRLGAGFVPVRKPGKLPRAHDRVEYALEYGTDALEMHSDAVAPAARVLIVDDVLATGGTAAAAVALAQGKGADVVAALFLLELTFLSGAQKLPVPVASILRY